MTASSQPQSADARIRELERLMRDLLRTGHGRAPHIRDLRDTDAAKVVDGQALVYSKADGKWHPVSLIPPFDMPGAVVVGISDIHRAKRPTRVRRFPVYLKVAGTSSTTVRLLHNGTLVAGSTVTLASGVQSGGVDIDVTYAGPEADRMQVEVTAAGTGAQGLTAEPY